MEELKMQSSCEKLAADNMRLVYYMFKKLQKTDITIRYSERVVIIKPIIHIQKAVLITSHWQHTKTLMITEA